MTKPWGSRRWSLAVTTSGTESLGVKVKRDVPLKIKPSDLRRQAAAMIRDGSMPPLETVLKAVADAREKYSAEIKGSRNRRGKRKSSPGAK
jgi:hypothetical protein